MEKIILVVGTPAESKKCCSDIVNTILDLPSKEMTKEDYYDALDRYLYPKANLKTNREERKPNTPIKESAKDTLNKSSSIEDIVGRIEGIVRPLPETILCKMNSMFDEALTPKEIESKAADFSLLYRISNIFDKYNITREELEEAIPKLDDMFSVISMIRTLGTSRKEDTPVKNTNAVSQEVEDNKEIMNYISCLIDSYGITPAEFDKEILPEFEKLIIRIGEERKDSLYSKVSEIVTILCTMYISTDKAEEGYLSLEEYAEYITDISDAVQKIIICKDIISTDMKLELLKMTYRVVQLYLYAMSHKTVLEYNEKGIDVTSYIVQEIKKYN